ncbi:MAG: glycosyl hydrolase [Pseudomonadales bacterium]|nr:glycosyl hydrolase [Pseudomonadales bacterium]
MIITNIINNLKKTQTYISLFCASALLTGCEASLDLRGVEDELSKSRLRTDQYQQMVMSEGVLTLVGSAGVVLSSRDEGVSWTRQEVAGSPNFIGLSLCPDQRLLALSFDRQVWSSSDQGRSWVAHALPTQEDMIGLTCGTDGSWWVSGSYSTLLHSSDQGQSWAESSFDEDALVTHIQFFDDQVGIAAAEFGLFFKTSDGGQSWDMIGTIGQELYPLTVHFSDPQNGWVGGLNGVIMHTEDGGETWAEQASGVESPIYRFFGQGDRLYAAGDHAVVLSYRDGVWVQLETPNIPIYLSAGQVLSHQQLLVAGGWGTLMTLSVTDAAL